MTDRGTGARARSDIMIGMISLGCPKNLVDGECMLGLLKERGYRITPDADMADYIIVNTCGFIDRAKKESIKAVLEMADKKIEGRCKGLIATGCLAERYRDQFPAELPEADAILGTGEYGRICEVVDGLAFGNNFAGGVRTVHESTREHRLGHLNAPRVLTSGAGYVYIKIAEGCGNNCSYCIIPAIRGPYISRPPRDIIAEAERVADGREIEAVLVAQDTTGYGSDIGGGDGAGGGESEGKGIQICDLIDGLSRIRNVRWIRLLYCYPDRIGDRLTGMLCDNDKLVRYLDMPIQHASDNILRKMGRRYGRSDLSELIGTLRRKVPGIALRTTVMTGFPGEGEDDFTQLHDFIAEAKFDRLGVFAYSREEGTAASKGKGRVSKRVAGERRAAIMETQAKILARSESRRVGNVYEAIVDRLPGEPGGAARHYLARTYAEAPEIDGYVRIRAGAGDGAGESCGIRAAITTGKCGAIKPGSFINIRITGIDANGLTGEMLT